MEKKKISGIKPPEPISHMVLWGVGSGWIFALLYLMFFWEMMWGGLDGIAGLAQEPLALLTNPLIWLGSFIIGAMPGTMLGMLAGLILRQLMKGVPIPFTQGDMQAIRVKVYGWIGLSTVAAGMLLTGLVFGFYGLIETLLIILLPSLIAAIASVYAAHRYLFRLRLWSEKQYGVQKEKVKNVEHLEDKIKYEEVKFEGEAQSQFNQK
jgi:hypothetical protein